MFSNELQQYFAENPTILLAIYCFGYLIVLFGIKVGKDNAQFAMFVFKILYYTVGLPLLVLNSIFKFFYRLIFKRPLSSSASKASAPNIVIDNPEVQIIGIKSKGKNNWTMTLRTRSDPNSTQMSVGGGNESGNGFVNGEQFTYRSYPND